MMTDARDDSPLHVPNLGARGIRRRLAGGVLWAILTAGVLWWLWFTHKPSSWFAVTGLTAAMSAAGFLQARARTCVLLAAMGTRDHDAPVNRWDDNARSCARQQARGVAGGAFLAGVLVSGLAYFVATTR